MTDYFAVLGLPRRPGLDEEALKTNYLRLAAALHPDAHGGDAEKFRELQEARQTLLDPAARLRHLFAMEGSGFGPAKATPPGDVFLTVAEALDAGRQVAAESERMLSAIARAALAAKVRRAAEKLESSKKLVNERRDARLRQIESQDALWPLVDLSALGEAAGELQYLGRWDKELKESIFRMRSVLESLLR